MCADAEVIEEWREAVAADGRTYYWYVSSPFIHTYIALHFFPFLGIPKLESLGGRNLRYTNTRGWIDTIGNYDVRLHIHIRFRSQFIAIIST